MTTEPTAPDLREYVSPLTSISNGHNINFGPGDILLVLHKYGVNSDILHVAGPDGQEGSWLSSCFGRPLEVPVVALLPAPIPQAEDGLPEREDYIQSAAMLAAEGIVDHFFSGAMNPKIDRFDRGEIDELRLELFSVATARIETAIEQALPRLIAIARAAGGKQ